MTLPRILVTGASGRVGGALMGALAGRAHAMAATRRPEGPDAVRFDFADPSTYAAALDGVDAVFLMRPPQVTSGAAFDPFLDAMERAGLRRLAVLSVRGADRLPVLPHHGMERHIKARDLDWTMLRPADFMQNLETVHCDDIRDRDQIAVPAGHGRSPFGDVEDVAQVAARVLTEPGHRRRAYALTGPDDLTFHDVAAALSRALDRPIRYRPVSVAAFLWRRRDEGAVALVMSALYTAQRLGLAAGTTDDVARILGRPAKGIDDWARRAADLFR